jgi:putative ABC transport system permease protein
VRDAITQVDEDITLSSVQTMRARLSDRLAQPKFRSAIVGLFALVGLMLSSIGLYAVLAYFVRQRRHEISVRLALGARVEDVAALVVRRGMILVAAGLTIGAAGAMAGGRLMSGWMFGIGTADPLTFVGVSLCLVTVALLACVVPALRAARLDPAEVLNEE